MAENKKSVLLYCDIIHTVEELDDSDAGLLFKHYLRYINDQNPEAPSKLIKIVFEPIKQNLKRDLKKWEAKSVRNSESAKKRWSERIQEDANASERTKRNANHADKDTVIVKVTDTVNEKDIVHGDSEKNTTSKKVETGDSLPTSKLVQSNLDRFKNDTTGKETMSKYVRALGRPLTIKRIIDLAEAHNIAFNEKHSHANYAKWCEYFRYFLEKHRETKQSEDSTYEPPYRKKLN